ncbi:MAG: Arc family DNA-binding protein [Candidatus Marinimicrobia bacterium]|nr:Arc family DNA-binding protein [Candidatus Neomarinimicrobiota bacterium]MBL7010985.1 Arc family DNA-binding protein [Candidatus Neomarinimicrobiota bacterium]MBL7031115.1 Arc family DNA-binding protein [Candidatus Neomarinimicrobiota bacterium]
MPDILIKKVPPELHIEIKNQAKKHHRSMNMEIITILENVLQNGDYKLDLPAPLSVSEPIDDDFINRAKRSGRE